MVVLAISAEAAAALAVAILALAIALLQEPIRSYFARAELSIEINKRQPDTNQIHLIAEFPVASSGLGRCEVRGIYVRIRVSHLEGRAAENAEVMASDLWRLSNGRRERVSTFLPMSLRWSHFQPPTTTTRVPIGGFLPRSPVPC